ncbi:MAG: hypothetical protein JSR82_10990 [Verrucomicrobia bacterium]|nr:hypothetical protein [Verrucomicrobiota bacterium]
MHGAGAGRGLLAQQAVFFLVGAAFVFAWPPTPQAARVRQSDWVVLLLALLLFLPLLGGWGTGPQRWLGLGGFRLYLAPLLLPALLLSETPWRPAAWLLAGAALAAQPDAAQATAWTVAALVGLTAPAGPLVARLGLGAGLLALSIGAWLRPDPLQPVDFVEGVFRLASGIGLPALLGAVLAAILPAVTLGWLAFRRRSVAVASAVAYWLTLVALAPLELTTVPLLGFGAGPVLGYLLTAFLAARALTRRD